MTLKLQGNSYRKEYVKCDTCQIDFVWLNAYPIPEVQGYYTRCRNCRQNLKQINKNKTKKP